MPKVNTNWRLILRKAWSVQLAVFWGGLSGAMLGLAAFSDILNPHWFLALNVIGYATIAGARLLKQPGLD